MSRLEHTLRRVRADGRKSLVPFLTGGYPDPQTFLRLLFALEQAGADAVEIGIPFSDPSADGPVIQASSLRALRGGVTVRSLLEAVREARGRGLALPLVFMTYYNPILAFGVGEFARACAGAGVDGVLVVDLPPEEAAEFTPAARGAGLATIFLVAPTTPEVRIPRVVERARGFVYCVSVTGVTGEKRPAAELVGRLVARVRPHTDLPLLVGFGVEDVATACSVAANADGVIVGSALLRAVGDLRGERAAEAALAFVGELRRGLDGLGLGG